MTIDDSRRELHALCATLEALRNLVDPSSPADRGAFNDAYALTFERAKYYAREYASALQREGVSK
jgi:hypothetical protein